jgi:hypothetical protein
MTVHEARDDSPRPARCRRASHAQDKSMLHPDTEIRFVSEEIGVGVFATRLLHKGTLACAARQAMSIWI